MKKKTNRSKYRLTDAAKRYAAEHLVGLQTARGPVCIACIRPDLGEIKDATPGSVLPRGDSQRCVGCGAPLGSPASPSDLRDMEESKRILRDLGVSDAALTEVLEGTRNCIICGTPSVGFGVFVPNNPLNYGPREYTPGKRRILFYGVCTECVKRSDTQERVEALFSND